MWGVFGVIGVADASNFVALGPARGCSTVVKKRAGSSAMTHRWPAFIRAAALAMVRAIPLPRKKSWKHWPANWSIAPSVTSSSSGNKAQTGSVTCKPFFG